MLLECLTTTLCPTGRLWLYAQRETAALRPMIAQWQDERMRQGGHAGRRWAVKTDKPSIRNIDKSDYDLAVLLPAAEKATQVAEAALRAQRPICILMPSTLIC